MSLTSTTRTRTTLLKVAPAQAAEQSVMSKIQTASVKSAGGGNSNTTENPDT